MARARKHRHWADEEKRSICLQTRAPGVSVAQVARRYAMNANLIFKWLKDPRFAPEVDEAEAEPAFLPVEISPAVSYRAPEPPSGLGSSGGRIEIELAGGHRISAEGAFDPDVLARLLKGLMS
jgi:transposase